MKVKVKVFFEESEGKDEEVNDVTRYQRLQSLKSLRDEKEYKK